MKFLKHFLFGHEPQNFRKGMVFLEDDGNNENVESEGEENKNLDEVLKSKTLTDTEKLQQIQNIVGVGHVSGLSEEQRIDIETLKNRVTNLSNSSNQIKADIDKIMSGERVDKLDTSIPEVTAKTAEELEAEAKAKKEVAEKVEEIGDETKLKTANALGEEQKNEEKTEAEQKAEDDAQTKAIKDGVVGHNENREQQDLSVYDKRKEYAKESREKIDKVANGIEYDESKRKEELKDREDLKDAGNYETAKLDGYNNFMKNFLDDDTKKLVAELDKHREDTFGKARGFQQKFVDIEKEENVFVKREKRAQLEKEFKEFVVHSKPGGKHYRKFKSYEEKIRERMNAIMGGKSKFKYEGRYNYKTGQLKDNGAVRRYFNDLNKEEDKYLNLLGSIQKHAFKKNSLNGEESFWKSFDERITGLEKFYNFDVSEPEKDADGKAVVKSKFQQDVEYLKSDIDETVEGTKYLEKTIDAEGSEVGFWKNRKAFEENLKRQQKDVKSGIDNLRGSIKNLESIVDKNSWKLDEEAFEEKFGESKLEARNKIREMKSQLRKTEQRMDELMQPNYYDKWLKRYSDPDTRQDAIRDISFFKQLDGNEGFIKKLEEKKNDIENVVDGETKTFAKVSLYDIYKMFEGYFEKREEDWQSRSKLAVAEIGTAFTDKDSPMHSKFQRELKSAQESEKTEAEEALNNRSTGEIKSQFLYKTGDVYMLWACIETLQARYDLNFREPAVIATLNRVRKVSHGAESNFFPIPEWQTWDDDKFNNEIHKYFTADPILGVAKANFWTANWVAEGMKKADEDYGVEAYNAVEDADKFRRIVSADYAKFAKGNTASVDKGYITTFIRKLLKRRKLNFGLQGDDVLWYIIQGLAIGMFNKDDMALMSDDFKATFPAFDFFIDSRSPKTADGRIVKPGVDPSARVRAWTTEDYQNWAKEISGGKMPTSAEEFTLGRNNDKCKRLEKFYFEQIVPSEAYDAAFYNAAIPNMKNVDFADHSLWAAKFTLDNALDNLQTASDSTQKFSSDGWWQILDGYAPTIKGLWESFEKDDKLYRGVPAWDNGGRNERLERLGEIMQTGLAFTETLVGNVNIGDRSNAKTLDSSDLTNDSKHMQSRANLHDIAFDFVGRDSKYGQALQQKLKFNPKIKSIKDDTQKALKELINEKAGKDIFSAKNVERVLRERYSRGGLRMAA